MAFKHYLEEEDDKPYFTTNSLGYYYDKMEGFAKAVEGSAKALNLTKEEVEKRLTLYIEQNKNELDQRLAQWDGKLETFDSSVEKLLTEWVDDGTLTHVIDSALIDQRIAPVAAKLAETGEHINLISNADMPLTIPTYDGSNQSVHPDVLYFPTPWNGYRYWMVSTPYPWTNDFHENPSITASVDGIEWVVPDGLTNPLDSVTTAESTDKIHLSDGVLVYRQDTDTLECWYRWTDETNRVDKFYRRTTKNGSTWTDKELVYEPAGLFVSPSVSFENGTYRMWGVPLSTYEVNYLESTDPTISWSAPVVVPVTYAPGETPGQMWHLDVYKEGSLSHLIWSEKTGSLYWSTSTNNGMSFSNTRKILSPSKGAGGWDNNHLYRASLLKVGNLYRLYYSALGSSPGRWYIGLTEGENLLALKGSSNITNYARKNIHRVFGESATYSTIETERGIIRVPPGKESWLRLIDTNRAGAGLKVGDVTGMLKVVKDDGAGTGDLHVVTLKTTNLRPNSPVAGVNAEGLFRVINVGPELPRFKLLNSGVSAAGLALDSKDTLKVIADNESVNGHLKAASVILNGASKNTTGEIRYNETLSKFQGLASGYWYDLNNYRPTPPTANISPGSTGDYSVDADYLYVCYQAGRWNRFAKTPW